MTLEFHPAVQEDFSRAIAYYEKEGGAHLADKFEAQFRLALSAVATSPTRFPFYRGSSFFRRIRLPDFPYQILYRELPGVIRITVLRHERRHPAFGTGRS